MSKQVEGPAPSERVSTRVEVRVVQVAVPVPQLDSLTYSVPDDFPDPPPGARVLVPLGKRVLTGIVLNAPVPLLASGSWLVASENQQRNDSAEPASTQPAAASDRTLKASGQQPTASSHSIKPIIDILDSIPFLPPDVVALGAWVAEYYACGIGEAIATAMPPRSWVESERHAHITDHGRARVLIERGPRRQLLEALEDGRPVRVESLIKKAGTHATLLGLERDGLVEMTQPLKGSAAAHRTVRVATLTAQGHDVASTPDTLPMKLGTRQQEALALLRGVPDGIETSMLANRGITTATINRLTGLSLVTVSRRTVDRDPFAQATTPMLAREPVVLTDEQRAAFARLSALGSAGGFRTVLLHGVTGSGKTELYLRLADSAAKGAAC